MCISVKDWIATVNLKTSSYFVVLVAQCRHAVVGRALFWPLLVLPSYFVQRGASGVPWVCFFAAFSF